MGLKNLFQEVWNLILYLFFLKYYSKMKGSKIMSLERPNWNDFNDRQLYDKLFYHDNNGKPLTEEEEEFCKTMYHFEEFASGLDG